MMICRAILVVIISLSCSLTASDKAPKTWTKDMKFATTLGIIWTGVIVHEELVWDMDRSFHTTNEKWFGKDTGYAGSDKVGHMYSAYFLVRTLTPAFEHYGYSADQALYRSIISSALLMTTMEITDGFTSHGFAINDIIANSLGQYLGYIMIKHPALSDKVDFRAMPFSAFETGKGRMDIGDYRLSVMNIKYFLALKGSGFAATRQSYLKYVDLHIGYDIYRNQDSTIDRNVFIGCNINVGNLVRETTSSPFTMVFDLIQLPFTMSEYFTHSGKTTLPK